MSQSPSPDATSDAIQAYDIGWAATNQLIRSGKSFSGRERNCAFLNTGADGKFADVSAAFQLDYPDDGRGIGLSDWDHDGRIDLWMMNRTAPRVRFLKNELETKNHFIALRLIGKTTNTDGIGARVRLLIEKGDPGATLTKSLHAGSGYLSQSSKWLHFGLGAETPDIRSVEVRWPGGEKEIFTGVSADNHFVLTEGESVASRWEPPAITPVAPVSDESAVAIASRPEIPSRVVLLNPAPVPGQVPYLDSRGISRKLADALLGQKLVLQFWATWCPNCMDEMHRWTMAREKLEEAGIKMLAICVDEPTGDERADDLKVVASKIRDLNYPFDFGLATAELIESLNLFQRTFIGRQSDLPLPSSILIDREGRASVVYKGPVTVDQLISDSAVCDATADQILATAIPYAGKWKTRPDGLKPRAVALKFTNAGYLEAARDYLHQILPLYEGAADVESRREWAECERFLGAIAHEEERYDLAETHYLNSVNVVPGQHAVHSELARVYMKQGKLVAAAKQIEELLAMKRSDFENLALLGSIRQKLEQGEIAIELYRESLNLRDHPETRIALANLLRDEGNSHEAVVHFAAALKSRADDAVAANNYAWILATHPDVALRNGEAAIHWATVACEATDYKIPPLLGTLAAALAESGRFEEAESRALSAVNAARDFDKPDLAKELSEKRLLYQSKRPFRDESLLQVR